MKSESSTGPPPLQGERPTSRRFNAILEIDGGFDILILSPRAAGVGLTLTAATHVIHLSRWWNPAVEEQCNDRIYRVGQEPEYDRYADEGLYKAASIQLKTVVDRGIEQFLYVYDFGDNWRHDLFIEEVRDGERDVDYPAFVEGERRGPPEDVGGVTGFMEFLEAIRNPLHEEHQAAVRWYGRRFEPDDIDERRVRMSFEMAAARRRGPLMSHRSVGRGRRT